jgi:hypothetical protein
MGASNRLELLALEYPIPAGNSGLVKLRLSTVTSERRGKVSAAIILDLEAKGTFVCAEHHRQNIATVIFVKLSSKMTGNGALDKSCFADPIVSKNDDLHLRMGLFEAVRS